MSRYPWFSESLARIRIRPVGMVENIQRFLYVAERYEIRFAEGAEGDLRSMAAYERRLVLDGLDKHLPVSANAGIPADQG